MVKNVVNSMTASPIELGRHPHDCCLQVNTAAPKPDKQIDLFLFSLQSFPWYPLQTKHTGTSLQVARPTLFILANSSALL